MPRTQIHGQARVACRPVSPTKKKALRNGGRTRCRRITFIYTSCTYLEQRIRDRTLIRQQGRDNVNPEVDATPHSVFSVKCLANSKFISIFRIYIKQHGHLGPSPGHCQTMPLCKQGSCRCTERKRHPDILRVHRAPRSSSVLKNFVLPNPSIIRLATHSEMQRSGENRRSS
jgi:hypothetical protein